MDKQTYQQLLLHRNWRCCSHGVIAVSMGCCQAMMRAAQARPGTRRSPCARDLCADQLLSTTLEQHGHPTATQTNSRCRSFPVLNSQARPWPRFPSLIDTTLAPGLKQAPNESSFLERCSQHNAAHIHKMQQVFVLTSTCSLHRRQTDMTWLMPANEVKKPVPASSWQILWLMCSKRW